MSAPLLTPGSGGGSKPKPVPYDPLSSIQAPKPKPEPQKPTVPLVVITAFDVEAAEKLKTRLQETIHPVDQPKQKETYDPLSSIQAPRPSSQPSLPDVEEPDMTATDLQFAWSSEAPFLSLDAGEMSDYFSALENDLVREVSISLQPEKFILDYLDDPLEYLKHFATYTWDEESDAAAEEFIQWFVERFKTELEKQREYSWSLDALSDIEYWIREVANDEWVSEALGGSKNLDFAKVQHRRGIGIAMVFQAHFPLEEAWERFNLYFESMPEEANELPPPL